MKVKLKTMALLTALVMLLTAFRVLADSDLLPAAEASDSEVQAIYLPTYLTDWTGIENGDGADDYTPRTYYTDLTGAARDAIRPRISENGQGTDGSYALLLGGESDAITRYETSLAFPKAGSLARRQAYTVSLRLRLLSGTADEVKLGLRETTADNYLVTLSGDELSDDWTEVTFEHTTGMQSNNYVSRLLISYTAPDGGATLLIDDISAVRNSDTTAENVFGNGTFDTVFYSLPFTEPEQEPGTVYLPYGVESLRHDYLFGFDGNIDDEISTIAVEEGAGISDSYALKLIGDGGSHRLLLKLPEIGTLQNESDYVLGFKVRGTGDVNALSLGVCEQWVAHAALSFTGEAAAEYITDSYRYYQVDYRTTNECLGAYNYIYIDYTLPTGTAVYLDDVEIYLADGDPDSNLYDKGSFNSIRYTKDFDNTPIPDMVYQPYTLADYDPVINYINSDPKNALKNNDNVSIVANAGVRNSCALKLAGNAQSLTSLIKLGTGAGYLKNETDYLVAVKLRREGAGSIDFTLGYTANWVRYPLLELDGDSIDDEYVYYGIKFRTLDNCWLNGVATLNHLWVNFTADAGTDLYIDEIELYMLSDETETNLFPKGTFDFGYYDHEIDDTPDGTVYKPVDLSYFTTVQYFFDDNSDSDNINNVAIVENEGYKGSSAFEITGDGNAHTLKFRLNSLAAMEVNTDYSIGLKVRRGADVEGEKSLSIGTQEKWTRRTMLQFTGDGFDEGITDSYHYYSVDFVASSECTGAWLYYLVTYTLPEGMKLYIDDLEIIPTGEDNAWIYDADGNPMNLLEETDFDYADHGQDEPHWLEDAPTDQTGTLSALTNRSNISGGIIADLGLCTDAISGNYVLKFGFDENNVSDIDYTARMNPSKPGEYYRISFWIKVCGPVDKVEFAIEDGRYVWHLYPINLNQYEYGKWTKVEFEYRDRTDKYTSTSYRNYRILVKAPAGSGVLVDNLSAVRTNCAYETPNILGSGNFEYMLDYPDIQWSDRYTYKK